MNVTEYRTQYEAELERAAREKVSFRDLLESSRDGQSEPRSEDDLTAAIAVIRNNHPDARLRAAALQLISLDIDENPELIGSLLEVLRDGTMPLDGRMAVLSLMQQISFSARSFPASRPDYLATLRSIIADPDALLRQSAIGILAQYKDEYVQRHLIEGLEGRSTPLVPAAMAIQCLGYDLHAEYFPLLRRIIEAPPSQAAKKEAVRLLAADPEATDLLLSILQDRSEDPEVRKLSAIALQAAVPDRFAEQARRIVFDDEDEDELRVVSLVGLTYSAGAVTMGVDSELIERVERLGTESASREMRQAVTSFLSRHGG
ncbi:MAG TPA: HEAT repeat domain-containing protein [Pseudonocardiaceae bacterium]|nr:HEAT repeat domain-containing protein [Pseudonocardiaceae bacterium]